MSESNLDRKKKSPQHGCSRAEGGNFPGTKFEGSRSDKTFNFNRMSLQAGGLCRSLLQALAEVAVFALLAIFASTRSM